MQLMYQTERLILKVLRPDYACNVLQFYQRNKDFFEPFEPDRIPTFYTENFHHTNLSYEYNLFSQSRYLRLWIFEKEGTNEIIGTICFSNILKGAFQSCMVGYKLDEAYCHRGYAKEALEYAVQLMFNQYGMHRIEALVLPTNKPSIRLMERVGFINEGMAYQSVKLNDKWEDHLRYALIHPL
jgi:Acetyltransferases, including N-acetylases of ribosomal proteins